MDKLKLILKLKRLAGNPLIWQLVSNRDNQCIYKNTAIPCISVKELDNRLLVEIMDPETGYILELKLGEKVHSDLYRIFKKTTARMDITYRTLQDNAALRLLDKALDKVNL